MNNDLWTFSDTTIWVPDNASDIQLHLCIIAHTDPAVHRGLDASEKALRSMFKWSALAEDVRAFVCACSHCLPTFGGKKITRPFSPAVHSTNPNDLLQFDYIDFRDSKKGEKYVLMLRDDHSDYTFFYSFPNTAT